MILVLGALTVWVWRAALNAPDGYLHLTVLDVGSGDVLLVQTPEGRAVLINGGPSSTRLSDGLGRRLPPFARELDWLVVASPVEAQVAGCRTPCPVSRRAVCSGRGCQALHARLTALRETLPAMNVEVVTARPGQALDLGSGDALQGVTVSDRGAVLLLVWDQFRALLPFGMDLSAQEDLRMGADIGRVSVLLLANQGYAPLNSQAWINNLNPQLVLLSVAADDRDDRPLAAAGRSARLDPNHHRWAADVGRGGEVTVCSAVRELVNEKECYPGISTRITLFLFPSGLTDQA